MNQIARHARELAQLSEQYGETVVPFYLRNCADEIDRLEGALRFADGIIISQRKCLKPNKKTIRATKGKK